MGFMVEYPNIFTYHTLTTQHNTNISKLIRLPVLNRSRCPLIKMLTLSHFPFLFLLFLKEGGEGFSHWSKRAEKLAQMRGV